MHYPFCSTSLGTKNKGNKAWNDRLLTPDSYPQEKLFQQTLLKDTILEQEKQTKLVNLLQSWIDEEDEQEQKETGEYLIEALDQDRLSERPLFPAELKEVTWWIE